MADPLGPARAKVQRADEHARDLSELLAAFKHPHPYRIVTLPHPYGGQPSRHIEIVRDVPVAIHLRVGEIVQGLRTALDYVAYALSFRRHGDVFASEVSFQVFDHLERIQVPSASN